MLTGELVASVKPIFRIEETDLYTAKTTRKHLQKLRVATFVSAILLKILWLLRIKKRFSDLWVTRKGFYLISKTVLNFVLFSETFFLSQCAAFSLNTIFLLITLKNTLNIS